MGRRVPLQGKILQGKILATPVQHTIRAHRRLALLEWRIESRAKRVLRLPRIIRPENAVKQNRLARAQPSPGYDELVRGEIGDGHCRALRGVETRRQLVLNEPLLCKFMGSSLPVGNLGFRQVVMDDLAERERQIHDEVHR